MHKSVKAAAEAGEYADMRSGVHLLYQGQPIHDCSSKLWLDSLGVAAGNHVAELLLSSLQCALAAVH